MITFAFAQWPGRALSGWRRDFDNAIGMIPAIGPVLAPRWRIYPVGLQELSSEAPVPSKGGGGPVVARLGNDAGLWLDVTLPVAAASDVSSAARLSLAGSSPIAPGEAIVAVDTTRVRREYDQLTVPVMIAAQETVARAEQLVLKTAGRLDALDVASGDGGEPPAIDLRTAAAATRSGVTPSAVILGLAAFLVTAGACAFAATLWVSASQPHAAASSRSNEERLLEELAAKRGAKTLVIEAVEAASRSLPVSSYLTQLEVTGSLMRLQGFSSDLPAVAPSLEADPVLSEIRFVGPLRETARGVRSFDVSLSLQPASGVRP